MRRTPLLLLLSVLLVGGSVLPSAAIGAAGLDLANPGFASDNVTWITTLPQESPGVGGKFVTVDGEQRYYLTGLKGVTIYNADDPANPVELGRLVFPHSQNEDVDVAEDGSRVVIGADGSLAVPVMPLTVGVHIVDTSDPTDPQLVGSIGESNHTATCADESCNWIYGNRGGIYDATDPENIVNVGSWFKQGVTGSHALNRSVNADGTPIMISDSTPRLVLDVSDPANPVELARSNSRDTRDDGALQHNNLRVDADQWVPRSDEELNAPGLRPGELMVGNSESNLKPDCGTNAGGLSTWSIKNFDRGQEIKPIDFFRPVNGTWSDGNPAVNGLGCSGHWFDVRDGLIAASWYEHGIRIIKIDPEDHTMSEVGFFNPVATEAGQAQWVTDAEGNEYIYSMDYGRGLDILKFDRDEDLVPTDDEIERSWLINLGRVGAFSEAERLVCRLNL